MAPKVYQVNGHDLAQRAHDTLEQAGAEAEQHHARHLLAEAQILALLAIWRELDCLGTQLSDR